VYLLRRGVSLVFTLWIALTIVFLLFRLLPGDPAAELLGPLASAEARAQLNAELGLDEPLFEQYTLYVGNLLQGDLGQSFSERRSVLSSIGPAFLNTFILVILTFLFAYGAGVLLGVLLAWYRGTRGEALGSALALVFRGAPSFWLGIMAITIFAVELGWLPAAGMQTIESFGQSSLETYLSWGFVKHLILPVSVAAVFAVGLPLLLVRNTMLDVIGSPYMEMAEAKGLSQRRLMFRHGARNATLPAVTASAQFVAWAMGGMVVIENVFSWPGLGWTIVTALEARDYLLAQGALLLIAMMVVVLNFAADVVTAYLDPRVKLV
jgi:peptide/nickel transport system permease protein